jgi:hypothetical protein
MDEMKFTAILAGLVLAVAQLSAYSDGLPPDKLNNSSVAPAQVADSVGAEVGLWFPDVPGDAEYLIHTIDDVTFIAGVTVNGIKGGADALYFESNCSGQPYIKEVTGSNFYQTRITIPYQETFSLLSEQFGEGISPLYYADSTSNYTAKTVCAALTADGLCNPIPGGCETLNVFPALTWDWSGYVQPFSFKLPSAR